MNGILWANCKAWVVPAFLPHMNEGYSCRFLVEALINKALSECKVPESIRVTKRGAPLFVRGNLLELECVFINLIRNAIEAQTTMTSDAFISIEWQAVPQEETGEAAEIRIANDGPVLTQSDIARMLEPLVSSKPDGLGLGLET